MKFFSKNHLLISLLSSTLSTTFLVSPGYAMEPAEEENHKITPLSRTIPSSFRESLPGDPYSAGYYIAVKRLFDSNNLEEKTVGTSILSEIVENKEHPYFLKAANELYSKARLLFWSADEKDIKIGIAFLRKIVENKDHPHHFSALQILISHGVTEENSNLNWYSSAIRLFSSDNSDKKEKGRKNLLEILQDTSDPSYYDTALNFIYSNNAEDKKIGIGAFKKILKNTSHPQYTTVLLVIFNNGNEEDKKFIRPIISELVKDPNYVDRYLFASSLCSSNNSEDKEIGRKVLIEIAQNSAHPNYGHAAQILIDSNNTEDQEIGVDAFRKMMQNNSHPQFVEGVTNLFYFGNEEDKKVILSIIHWLVKDPNNVDHNLTFLFTTMLDSPFPEVQKQAETTFLDDPLILMKDYFSLLQLEKLLMQQEESKKNLWLQKICEALQSFVLEGSKDEKEKSFNTACLLLKMSDKEQFVIPAKSVFLNMLNTQVDPVIFHARRLLQSIKDADLKEKIISRLLNIAQNLKIEAFYCESETHFKVEAVNKVEALNILLEQNDEKVKTLSIDFCQKLFDSLDLARVKQAKKSLSTMGLALNEIAEGKPLAQQILTLLSPEFQKLLLESDAWLDHLPLLKLFMKMGDENQQLQIFNLIKEGILALEEGDEDNAEDAADLIIESLGVDHLWSQELIDLATKLTNIDNPNSSFAVYKQLREQMDQPVEHHLPKVQLEDDRTVTFNLKTLQAKRKFSFIPMKHGELVCFTNQVLAEAEKYPEEFNLCATECLQLDRQTAIKAVNTAFFKNSLDSPEETKDFQKISLTSFKLRHILTAVKELKLQEAKGVPSQVLSPSSQLILSLLNNVLTCPTGKDDGIDATYRLLTNRLGASEEDLQQERLREEMHEFFKEEMRCMRETLLSGNGPVVRSLLNPSITEEKELKKVKIEEAPHQAKYLGNLLGIEIGTFLEGKGVTFDQNGGCVSPELRKCSKQKALDKLYEYHTPKTAIAYFHELFKAKGFKGKIDGKNTLSDIIAEFLPPEQLESSDYFIFDDFEMPIGLTRLAIAEILIKTHILEVVEKD